jgi:RNA polymerase sigma-70 factor (ECF subfamily)
MRSSPVGNPAVRLEADRIEATEGRSGYRRRRTPARTEAAERLVRAAVELARGGEEDAVRLLYLLYADDLYGSVLSVVRDAHDAEDITSDVFARLPRALRRYRPGPAPFGAWLLRVGRNAALDHLRDQRTIALADVHAVDEPADDVAHERLEALRTALAALPPDQRKVMLLRLIAGLSPAEIAVRMNRSEDAVHALQHRARRRLRRELLLLGSAPTARAA